MISSGKDLKPKMLHECQALSNQSVCIKKRDWQQLRQLACLINVLIEAVYETL